MVCVLFSGILYCYVCHVYRIYKLLGRTFGTKLLPPNYRSRKLDFPHIQDQVSRSRCPSSAPASSALQSRYIYVILCNFVAIILCVKYIIT